MAGRRVELARCAALEPTLGGGSSWFTVGSGSLPNRLASRTRRISDFTGVSCAQETGADGAVTGDTDQVLSHTVTSLVLSPLRAALPGCKLLWTPSLSPHESVALLIMALYPWRRTSRGLSDWCSTLCITPSCDSPPSTGGSVLEKRSALLGSWCGLRGPLRGAGLFELLG